MSYFQKKRGHGIIAYKIGTVTNAYIFLLVFSCRPNRDGLDAADPNRRHWPRAIRSYNWFFKLNPIGWNWRMQEACGGLGMNLTALNNM